MSLKIIRRRERITTTRHIVAFSWENMPGAGFSFECDEKGEILDQTDSRLGNYAACLREVAAGTMRGPFRETESGSYVQPTIAECKCGAEIVLSDPLDNGCENCGRWFNMSGQEVVNPNSDLGRKLRAEDDRYADEY